MPREWDLNRRVVVRKLPENATKGEITDLFGRFGKINKIFIARNPAGFAFLEYRRRRDAEAAVTRGNGKRCCGFKVSVELTITDLDRTVVIRNLKRTVSKEDIRKVFNIYGRITKIWLERFQQILAFVEYVRRSDAKAAARATDGKRCCGCVISVYLPRNPKPQARRELRQTRDSSSETSLSESASASTSRNRCDSTSNRISRARCSSSITSSSSQRLDCSICTHNTLENRPNSTPCGHVFCETCIKSALLRAQKCPICQQALKVESLIRMFPS